MIIAMSRHTHIVELHQVIMQGNQLYYVFEYLPDGCLHEWIQQHRRCNQPTTDAEVRHTLQQILKGLEHVHKHGLCHRDIKPENILQHSGTWKIADFSLARRVTNTHEASKPPENSNFPLGLGPLPFNQLDTSLTTYVSTRWYRAPEVLLHCVKYGTPIDVYATACVVVEMYNQRPLFPGQTETDQLHRITKLLGTTPDLNKAFYSLSISLPADNNVRPDFATRWKSILPMTRPFARDLLSEMIAVEPLRRLTCSKALQHSFFRNTPAATMSSDRSATVANKAQIPGTKNLTDSVMIDDTVPTHVTASRPEQQQTQCVPKITNLMSDPPCSSNRRKEPPHHVSPPPLNMHNPYKKNRIS